MAVIIVVQMLFALLFAAQVCECTNHDLNSGNVVVGVVRRNSNFKEKSKDSAEFGVGDLTEGRKKRSLSPNDRTDIVMTVNDLRGRVGASDMPYMTYSIVQENNAALWTADCNLYKPVENLGRGLTDFYYMREASSGQSVPRILLLGFMWFSRQFGSVYLKRIGCDQRKCGSVTFEGRNYTDLTLCIFEAEMYTFLPDFNSSVMHYTLGEACTTCQSGSYWCYKGLCRDDCSSQISNCSCFSGCRKCPDWNRESCTCPSQPKVNATFLDCYNKGEMAFSAEASLVIIVLSTLVLFGLQ